jgi:PKD repeat protein
MGVIAFILRLINSLLPILLFVVSVRVIGFGGAIFVNDTGQYCYGARVTFSEPVKIVSKSSPFYSFEPKGISTTFVFASGTIKPNGFFWISWEPSTATLTKFEWLFSMPRPDLVIESVTWSPNVPKPGETIVFRVIIKNIGEWSAGSFHVHLQGDSSSKYYSVYSLGANSSREIVMTHTFSASPETFTITVDAKNVITELNETNNIKTLTITGFSPNTAPLAKFEWVAIGTDGSRLIVQPKAGDTVMFDASASYDPDGRIVKYEWDWTSDGTYDLTTENPVVEHRFPTPGSHRVTLRVTDDKGATATTTQTMMIGEKKPPVPDFTFSPASPSILDTVQFTDRSLDPDGRITLWRWEFGDGGTSTEQNPSHRYADKKTFTVKLTVTDNDGQSASTMKTITVVNLPPEAFFIFTPKDPYVGQEIAFDASSSQDKDGKILAYAWDFTGDGAPDREGARVTWTFFAEGTYTVTLTVTDDDGAKAIAKETLTVTVSPQPVEAKQVWALVVGISDYGEVRDLRYAREDAEAFYSWLTRKARVPSGNVRLLLDRQATLTEVRGGLEWLRRRAEKDDLVIVFFAGHGYQGTDLPPVDEKDGLDEYLVLWDTKSDAMEATALRDDEFGQFLDRLLSNHVLVVFDSCYAGGGERGNRGLPRGARPATTTLDLWGDFNLEGKIVLAAAGENEESYEESELGHGVFTHFLLQGLEGEADENKDGKVTVQEVYAYVSREVSNYVREKVNAEQHPQLIGRGTPQVVVAKGNLPPRVDFTYLPEAPFPGKEVQFRDASTDDGKIVGWNWDFGDGATSTEQHPVHAYQEPGTYQVTLTVTDDGGLASTVGKELAVGPYGEVTAIDPSRGLVTISLGSRHGVQVGDRFEVIHVFLLSDGTKLVEVRALIEVAYLASPERSVCRILQVFFSPQVKDLVRPLIRLP